MEDFEDEIKKLAKENAAALTKLALWVFAMAALLLILFSLAITN